MPVTNRPRLGALPELPHWETTPIDRPEAIGKVKEALRTRIQASGRSISEVFSVIETRVRTQVDEIAAAKAEGREVWPVINYSDIATDTVSTDDLALLHRRGCVVVRGNFPRQRALDWDQGIVDYVERNRFFEDYRGPGDDFFGSVGSKPEIYPIYWSQAQMEARQSESAGRLPVSADRVDRASHGISGCAGHFVTGVVTGGLTPEPGPCGSGAACRERRYGRGFRASRAGSSRTRSGRSLAPSTPGRSVTSRSTT